MALFQKEMAETNNMDYIYIYEVKLKQDQKTLQIMTVEGFGGSKHMKVNSLCG